MKNLIRLSTVVAAYLATTGTAHAVFDGVPLPEPGSLGLLVAGGVAMLGIRYLSKCRRDAKRDE